MTNHNIKRRRVLYIQVTKGNPDINLNDTHINRSFETQA